ncbi:MAG: ComF family protein [Deltaproteobacteria bacterium]|nr:ComF family protein [Deltaproteobacteria bacterium]
MHAVLAGLLDLVAPRRCAACDRVTDLEKAVFCRACDASIEDYHGVGAVFEYGGPAADAIRRFKYEGRSDLGRTLGSRMADEAGVWAGRVDAVIPVPLHWRRRRSRGYDQAALLARPVARALRVPSLFRCLRRARNTPSQADLPRAERLRNVRGAFQSRPLAGSPHILLVDDVRTTGATLCAATDALRAAGAGEVHTLVLAVRLLGGAT